MSTEREALFQIAHELGIDTVALMEDVGLSHQQKTMSRMTRIILLGEFSDKGELREGVLEKDLLTAVTRMDTKELIDFDRNVPKLLRALDRASKAFVDTQVKALDMLQDHAGLPDDEAV